MKPPEEPRALRVALLGGGQIVLNHHLPALLKLGHQIVFAYDPSASALRDLQSRCSNSLRVSSSDPHQIPADADCVLVASPSALHARQVQTQLEKGRAVFCEKPLACRTAEANALVELAQKSGTVLQVGYYRRHFPALRLLGDWLKAGIYGAPVRILICGGNVAKGIPESFLNPALSGGGVLMDFGVHAFDLLASWCELVEIESYVDDARPNGVEANAQARLACRVGGNTLPAIVKLSRTCPLGYFVTVDFAKASVRAELNGGNELILTRSGDRPLRRSVGEPHDTNHYFAEQWREFSSRLRGGPEITQRLAHAALATQLAENCYNQKQTAVPSWGD